MILFFLEFYTAQLVQLSHNYCNKFLFCNVIIAVLFSSKKKFKSAINREVDGALMINLGQDGLTKYFFLIQKETFTKMINAGTSTKGPITAANACPLLIPKTPMETAIASSKLLPEAVKESATASR